MDCQQFITGYPQTRTYLFQNIPKKLHKLSNEPVISRSSLGMMGSRLAALFPVVPALGLIAQ